MGEDGDDGYNPEIKLKGASDVIDQVDKDTEEVLDFNFVPGSASAGTGSSGGGTGKDDSVDGLKGDSSYQNGNSVGDWGMTHTTSYFWLFLTLFLLIIFCRNRSDGT